MSEVRIQSIEALLAGVDSLESLDRKLESTEERELLKRAALIRCFDEAVFKNYLCRGISETAPRFGHFVMNLNVEPIPRTAGMFAIKEESRTKYLNQLLADHRSNNEQWQSTSEVFEELLKHFVHKKEFELDHLAILAVVRPIEAQADFNKLYQEADSRFDLARCNDLLRTLESRSILLSDELNTFCRSTRQYYNSRNLFIGDYYQTTTYLERDEISTDFDKFFDPQASKESPWLFHIYATGGLGKTMFVRWLISRQCLPDPRRIPVARLDCDLLNLEYVSQHPFLLLLPIVNQLNRQVEQRPFTEKFSHIFRYLPLLEPLTAGTSTADRSALEKDYEETEKYWQPSALTEFKLALQDAKFTGPILIAIDTVEEMLLLNKDSLTKIIEQVRDMQKEYSPIRLVLSGRYDLRKDLVGLKDLFENEAINFELERFSTPEAKDYLVLKRGLTDEPLCEAVVEKCTDKEKNEVNPFILSLMADLVTSKEIQTVEEVKKYPRAEVAYMIRRIIDRIKDPDIRWLLRYAVIPRVLTLDVLKQIMWKHLVEEREKKRGLDLSVDPSSEGAFDQKQYWEYGSGSSPEDVWDKLKPFVSSYGWVSYDEGDPDRIRLHPEVVVPMRFLLAKEEVFSYLHRDAIDYFLNKERNEPQPSGVWLCEALYHRFQIEGPKATGTWRRNLSSKLAESDMEARRRIATEVTKRDYVDEKGLPRKWPDDQSETDIVSIEDLCFAHHEAAIASMMLAAKYKQKANEYAIEWKRAHDHLVKLQSLLARPSIDFTPEFVVEDYRKLASELAKTTVDYPVVVTLMEAALKGTRGLYLPLGIKSQLAEAYASIGSANASESFREALSASRFLRIPFLSPFSIQFKLARWYQNRKHFAEALAEYTEILGRPEVGGKSNEARQVEFRMAEVRAEIAQPVSAANLSQQVAEGASDEEIRLESDLLHNKIVSENFFDPLQVLTKLSGLQSTATSTRSGTALMELHGSVLSQLFEFDSAVNLLERAKEQWGTLGETANADRIRMKRIELQLDQIGNLNEAEALLESWDSFGDKTDAEFTAQMEMVRVRFLYLSGKQNEASERWLEAARRETNLRAVARVMASGLALRLGDDQTIDRLNEALQQIEPSSARLPLLSAFRYSNRGDTSGPTKGQNRLIRLIAWPPEKRPAFSSIVLFADVLNYCGAMSRLEELIQGAIERAGKQRAFFAVFQLLAALDRASLYAQSEPILPATDFFGEYSNFKGLCFAACLQQAERELAIGEMRGVQESLKNAGKLKSKNLTRWSALAEELAARLKMATSSREEANPHLNAAAAIYDSLGDKASAEDLLRRLPKVETKVSDLSELPRTWVINVSSLEDELVVHSEGLDGESQSKKISYGDFSNLINANHRERGAILELTERILEDPYEFAHSLADTFLGGGLIQNTPKEGPFDIRFEVFSSAAKIPWEWIIAANERILRMGLRYLYRGRRGTGDDSELIRGIQVATGLLTSRQVDVDGYFGPKLSAILRDLGIDPKTRPLEIYEQLVGRQRGDRGPRKKKVLIIKPSLERQIVSVRGFSAGFSLRYFYEEALFQVAMIETDQQGFLAEDLTKFLQGFQPNLIHIESSFTLNPRRGDIYLNFIHEEPYTDLPDKVRSRSRYEQLSPTLLSDLLARLPARSQRPLVIIEGQASPGATSSVEQMLMRNTFASELYRLQNTSGVIATGFFLDEKTRVDLLQPLIHQLSFGISVGKVIFDMFSANWTMLTRSHLYYLSLPVLFTNNPSLWLLPSYDADAPTE